MLKSQADAIRRMDKFAAKYALTDAEIHIEIMVEVFNGHMILDIIVHINWYLFGTDAGGDMQGSRTIFFCTTANDIFSLGIWPFCLCHQGHLMVFRPRIDTPDAGMKYNTSTSPSRPPKGPNPPLYPAILCDPCV